MITCRCLQVKAKEVDGKVIWELAEFPPDKALQILDQVRSRARGARVYTSPPPGSCTPTPHPPELEGISRHTRTVRSSR